jgi:hypothetical protein
VQAERGVLAQQLFSFEIELGAGELYLVGEGLAEAFFAAEGKDIEAGLEVADPEFMAAVVEENGWCGAHVQTSLRAYGEASFPSLVQVLDSFREADTC